MGGSSNLPEVFTRGALRWSEKEPCMQLKGELERE